jgi:hypothetical protein
MHYLPAWILLARDLHVPQLDGEIERSSNKKAGHIRVRASEPMPPHRQTTADLGLSFDLPAKKAPNHSLLLGPESP